MVAFKVILALATATIASASAFQKALTDSPNDITKSDFDFENPETNCKYVSQPWIYDIFQNIATDMENVFKFAGPDITFRIMVRPLLNLKSIEVLKKG